MSLLKDNTQKWVAPLFPHLCRISECLTLSVPVSRCRCLSASFPLIPVTANLGCQLHNQLSNCLFHVSLWAYLWNIFWIDNGYRRASPTVGGTIIPRQEGLGCARKIARLQPGSKVISSVLPGFLFQAPPLTSAWLP